MSITKRLGYMTHADLVDYPGSHNRIHRHLAEEVQKAADAAGLTPAALDQIVTDTGRLTLDPTGPRNTHGVMSCLPEQIRLKNLKEGDMAAASKTTMLPVHLARILVDVRQNGAANFDVVAVSEPTSRWFAGYAILMRDKNDAVTSVSLFDPNNRKLASVAPQTLAQLTEVEPQIKLMRLAQEHGLKSDGDLPRGAALTEGARLFTFRNGEIIRRLDGSHLVKSLEEPLAADVQRELNVTRFGSRFELGAFIDYTKANTGEMRYRFTKGEILQDAKGALTLERNDGVTIPSKVLALCAKYELGFFEGGVPSTGPYTLTFSAGRLECNGPNVVRGIRMGSEIDLGSL